MTDEKKITNSRNSRKFQSAQNNSNSGKNESMVKFSEEKLTDFTSNLRRSLAINPSINQADVVDEAAEKEKKEKEEKEDDEKKDNEEDAPTTEGTTETSEQPESAEAASVESAQPPSGENADQTTPVSDTPAVAEAATDDKERSDSITEEKEEKSASTSSSEGTNESKTTKISDKSEKDDKPTTKKVEAVSSTEKPDIKDPYRIDIPLEKKINKRTQKKLWEEIEKRKPLIPRHVAMHIQKYAKPPFETWGCKYANSKGSCYGCK